MKKKLYFLFALLSMAPSMATQNVTKSFIIASTLVLSNANSHRDFNITTTFDSVRVSFNRYDKNLSLELHKAIEKGYYFSAQKLITNPQVDVNAKVDYYAPPYKLMKSKGCTPLIQCCQKGDEALEIAKVLLRSKSIDVNLQDTKGWTPLIQCCNHDKSLKIAKALLGHKRININLPDKLGCTPLIWCCTKGDKSLKMAKALLKHKHVNVNLQDNDGWTPLIWCCANGNQSLKIAKALIDHDNININLGREKGDTPLIWCCAKGDEALGIAKALLGHKYINVNLQRKNGWTPLIQCCTKGDKSLEIAKALLRYEFINVNLQNNNGDTPLIECSWRGDESLQIARALLGHKDINVNLQNNQGHTPLDNIVYQIKYNKNDYYTYVKLWNILVAKGAVLGRRKEDYANLVPDMFKEPKKSYVKSIINNPPKDSIKLIQELTEENNLLRKQLEELKKRNNPFRLAKSIL